MQFSRANTMKSESIPEEHVSQPSHMSMESGGIASPYEAITPRMSCDSFYLALNNNESETFDLSAPAGSGFTGSGVVAHAPHMHGPHVYMPPSNRALSDTEPELDAPELMYEATLNHPSKGPPATGAHLHAAVAAALQEYVAANEDQNGDANAQNSLVTASGAKHADSDHPEDDSADLMLPIAPMVYSSGITHVSSLASMLTPETSMAPSSPCVTSPASANSRVTGNSSPFRTPPKVFGKDPTARVTDPGDVPSEFVEVDGALTSAYGSEDQSGSTMNSRVNSRRHKLVAPSTPQKAEPPAFTAEGGTEASRGGAPLDSITNKVTALPAAQLWGALNFDDDPEETPATDKVCFVCSFYVFALFL